MRVSTFQPRNLTCISGVTTPAYGCKITNTTVGVVILMLPRLVPDQPLVRRQVFVLSDVTPLSASDNIASSLEDEDFFRRRLINSSLDHER